MRHLRLFSLCASFVTANLGLALSAAAHVPEVPVQQRTYTSFQTWGSLDPSPLADHARLVFTAFEHPVTHQWGWESAVTAPHTLGTYQVIERGNAISQANPVDRLSSPVAFLITFNLHAYMCAAGAQVSPAAVRRAVLSNGFVPVLNIGGFDNRPILSQAVAQISFLGDKFVEVAMPDGAESTLSHACISHYGTGFLLTPAFLSSLPVSPPLTPAEPAAPLLAAGAATTAQPLRLIHSDR